jgi:hypothetical protein
VPVPARQRLFRLLGLHPGGDFTAHSAAALADLTPADAEALLESMLDEYVLQQQTAGRYRFHDKIRRLAGELVLVEDTADERLRAVRRCLTWLLHPADAAVQAVEPHRRRTFELAPYEPSHPAREFASWEDALRWCQVERANLVAAVHTAARERQDDIAWQLPAVLLRFFYLRSHWADWLETHRIALEAAPDARARATVLNGLGVAYGDLRRFDEAIDCCTRAAGRSSASSRPSPCSGGPATGPASATPWAPSAISTATPSGSMRRSPPMSGRSPRTGRPATGGVPAGCCTASVSRSPASAARTPPATGSARRSRYSTSSATPRPPRFPSPTRACPTPR